MYRLERNVQADDEDQRKTNTFRTLKDRVTGLITVQKLLHGYNPDNCRLIPKEHEDLDFSYDDDNKSAEDMF